MTQFTPTRFTHQNKDEYGQGKKVTTKILETDAENTEYLYQELQETRQTIHPTLTQTYAPIQSIQEETQNMTTTTTETQDITSNTGKQYHIQTQTTWTIQGNNTTAHLETEHITTQGRVTQIIAPAITTGTTTTKKSVMTAKNTLDIPILGTLEEITGSSTGEVQSDSLLQEYYDEVRPANQYTRFGTYNSFLTWLGQVNWDSTFYPFPYWLALKKQKTIYGLYMGGELPLLWAPEWVQTVQINEDTTEYTMNKTASSITIPSLATVPFAYEGGDVLHITGKFLALQNITDDTINLSYDRTEIEVEETPSEQVYTYTLDCRPLPEELQVHKNNQELIQSVDYRYNLKTRTIQIQNVSAGDYIEIIRSISGMPRDIQLFYDTERENTQSQLIILPVQVHYIPDE